MAKGSARTLKYWLDLGYSNDDAERMRRSRIPGTIEYFMIFKKMNKRKAIDSVNNFQSKKAVTLENMIKKYGTIDGEIRWQLYKEKQAYTNSYDYKNKKYGWTLDDWVAYNKSRGRSGIKNGNYNSSYYQIWIKKYGKQVADEMNLETSKKKSLLGIKHGNYKRPKRPEELKKMSESAIKRILKNGTHINYNPKSIPIIEQYGRENGYNFQHAQNGGEYQITGTTFFVDAYDKNKNVVLEYDEYNHKYNKEYDINRQNIIGNTLNCTFIRIDYKNNITITKYENKTH